MNPQIAHAGTVMKIPKPAVMKRMGMLTMNITAAPRRLEYRRPKGPKKKPKIAAIALLFLLAITMTAGC